jgi:hypothetical protein
MRRPTSAALPAALALAVVALSASAGRADYVPPFKGNDTGGIISTSLVGTTDVRALAVNHCAQYDKVVKLRGVQPGYGGYISFACIWAPPGRLERPLRVRY